MGLCYLSQLNKLNRFKPAVYTPVTAEDIKSVNLLKNIVKQLALQECRGSLPVSLLQLKDSISCMVSCPTN